MDEQAQLIADAAALGVPLDAGAAARLLQLIDELLRWNRSYNLTAIRQRDEAITHHLLDSLSIHPWLHGSTVADVGTGAGFPGLPLAIVNPQRQFTLIDSSNKKVRFVAHAARLLGLSNVAAVHSRVETLRPPEPFDTVIARAFASLAGMLKLTAGLCGPDTHVLAMKGRRPDDELAALPEGWTLLESTPLEVPRLGEARCVLVIARRAEPPAAAP